MARSAHLQGCVALTFDPAHMCLSPPLQFRIKLEEIHNMGGGQTGLSVTEHCVLQTLPTLSCWSEIVRLQIFMSATKLTNKNRNPNMPGPTLWREVGGNHPTNQPANQNQRHTTTNGLPLQGLIKFTFDPQVDFNQETVSPTI